MYGGYHPWYSSTAERALGTADQKDEDGLVMATCRWMALRIQVHKLHAGLIRECSAKSVVGTLQSAIWLTQLWFLRHQCQGCVSTISGDRLMVMYS